MANRPIFIPSKQFPFVIQKNIEFKWFAGLSLAQQQRTIGALHQAAIAQENQVHSVLEISTKSKEELGKRFSAFNLKIRFPQLPQMLVEGAYQSGKIYKNAGPFPEFYGLSGQEIKKQMRQLREDKKIEKDEPLLGFRLNGVDWGLEPKNLFFDWIYFNALFQLEQKQPDLIENLQEYDAFTDINFNPKKGVNCQASSLSKYLGMKRAGFAMEEVLSEPSRFQQLFTQSLEQ